MSVITLNHKTFKHPNYKAEIIKKDFKKGKTQLYVAYKKWTSKTKSHRLKIKCGHVKATQKKPRADRVNSSSKDIARDEEGHFIAIKESKCPNNEASK